MDASILTKQIGPLPVVGWLVGVGGGVAYLVYKNRNGGPPTSVLGEENPDELNDKSPFSSVGAGPGGWIATPLPQPAPAEPMLTNQQWADKASRELMARNYDPALIDSMVRKAVGGLAMTPAELVLFRLALTIVGPLPEVNPPAQEIEPTTPIVAPPTPTPTAPPTTGIGNPSYNGIPLSQFPPGHVFGSPAAPATPAPTQPAARFHTVVRGDTLSSIAKHFYGSASQWPKIYNANRNIITNPNVIYAGQRLVIP